MKIYRYTINVVTTTALQYVETTPLFNGLLRGITYDRNSGNPISSTATLRIRSEDLSKDYLVSLSVSGENQEYYPMETSVVNTTNGSITDYQLFHLSDERINFSITLTSAAGQEGEYDIFIQGSS
jgi:hypothetical protein